MDAIANNLRDPSWWFTAVFIAIVAGVVGSFLKEYLARRWGIYLAWTERARDRGEKQREEILRAWSASESLVILTFLKMVYSLIVWGCTGVAVIVLFMSTEQDTLTLTDAVLVLVAFLHVWFALNTPIRMAQCFSCLTRFCQLRGLPELQ